LLHKRLKFAGETAYTPQAAIDILLKMYGVARKDVGLPEKPESPKKKAVQTSMKSFFAPKTNNNKTTATAVQADHNCDGRFQFFSFQDMDLIQTYVPNNGMKEESFQRRRQWDQDMLDFFQARDKILQHARDTDRLLLWCGDMNVAHDHRDGTHWERRPSEELYEWWTDESKCLASSAKKTDPNRSPDDRGMPSFTPVERRRFANLLQTANLVDVWRDLHPDGSSRSDLKQWDRPEWTWRGHLGKGGVRSKYEGKGQRLDYFLLSPYNKDSIKACDILGYGSQREGLFCGSDHCASVLVLKKNNNNNKEDEKA
jgi:exonuclease III